MPIVDPTYAKQRRRKHKRSAVLKDPQSTGRKRAAILFPLDRSGLCEWSKAFISQLLVSPESEYFEDTRPLKLIAAEIAGCMDDEGNLLPFRICEDNLQVNRHHGPDKNTLNNEPGNVHRICAYCHNMWHAIMDEDWDGEAKSD